jgi:membrane-bound lytic murein transglycosylase D
METNTDSSQNKTAFKAKRLFQSLVALSFIAVVAASFGAWNQSKDSSKIDIQSATSTEANNVILETLVVEQKKDVTVHREDILNDYQKRISDEFNVPEGLRDRVGFWFDIYSRYDSNMRVIHHTQFPWIIFKVVDVTPIINADKPKFRWMRNMKADDAVAAELKKIKKAASDISKGIIRRNDKYQELVAKALEPLKGSLKKNARIAAGATRVQMGQKDFFARGIEVSPQYLSGMEEIFRNNKLPTELTRLPFVESSFNKHATSKVGASGIWQFMDYTGKNFMIVNDHIDERRSPFKATEAAARLLKENHMILKRSWPMAITAWNHGPGGIRKAAQAAGTTDLAKIIERYQSKSFDFASSNFYCEFLAALYTEKYQDHIFDSLNREKTLDLHAVKLAKTYRARDLMKKSGLSSVDFLYYNPDLKNAVAKNVQIPAGFTFMVDTPSRLILKGLLTKGTQESDTRVSRAEETKPSDSKLSQN